MKKRKAQRGRETREWWKVVLEYLIMIGLGGLLGFYIAHSRWVSLRPDNPPETFREEELIGIWKADYKPYDWERCGRYPAIRGARALVEWLVLREEKTFFQVLQDRRGKIPEQRAQGQWWVERFPDGVTRLHLEGGRFFAGDVCRSFPELTIGGEAHSFDQTEHELHFEPGKAVLIVGWDRHTQELHLEYPFVNDHLVVKFKRVPESEAGSVPTPEP